MPNVCFAFHFEHAPQLPSSIANDLAVVAVGGLVVTPGANGALETQAQGLQRRQAIQFYDGPKFATKKWMLTTSGGYVGWTAFSRGGKAIDTQSGERRWVAEIPEAECPRLNGLPKDFLLLGAVAGSLHVGYVLFHAIPDPVVPPAPGAVYVDSDHYGYSAPLWLFMLIFGACFGLCLVPSLRRRRRRRKRKKLGLCLKCGYDLRASKDRCPECGSTI